MYVALHEVTWCMVVWCTQNLRRDGCSFMWHQPCQRCKYTTSVDIQKARYKKLVSHVAPHASAVSLLKRAENSAIQAIINNLGGYSKCAIESYCHSFRITYDKSAVSLLE